jgi:hypothetical protein
MLLALDRADITLPFQCKTGERARARKKARTGSGTMKLLSFVADDKEWFGAVSGDDVVTLNDKIEKPNLRSALAADAMEIIAKRQRSENPIVNSPRSNSHR